MWSSHQHQHDLGACQKCKTSTSDLQVGSQILKLQPGVQEPAYLLPIQLMCENHLREWRGTAPPQANCACGTSQTKCFPTPRTAGLQRALSREATAIIFITANSSVHAVR